MKASMPGSANFVTFESTIATDLDDDRVNSVRMDARPGLLPDRLLDLGDADLPDSGYGVQRSRRAGRFLNCRQWPSASVSKWSRLSVRHIGQACRARRTPLLNPAQAARLVGKDRGQRARQRHEHRRRHRQCRVRTGQVLPSASVVSATGHHVIGTELHED